MCPLGETFLGPVGPQTQNIQRQFSSNAVIPRKSCSTHIIVHTIPTKCWLHSRTFPPTPFSQPLSQNLWNLSPKQLSPLGPFLVTSPSSRSLCTIFTAVPAASSLAFPSFLGWTQIWPDYGPAHRNFQGWGKPAPPQASAHSALSPLPGRPAAALLLPAHWVLCWIAPLGVLGFNPPHLHGQVFSF